MIPHYQELMNSFHNQEAYVVGGAVRNWLMGEPISDIDIAVNGDAKFWARKVAARVDGSVVNVEKHNTARVAIGGKIIYDISGFYSLIQEDLAERDFTMNALAVPLSEWNGVRTVVGQLDGIDDARSRTLRAVSDGIFKADSVRLLRAFRLTIQYGLTLDSSLGKLIIRDSDHLANAAAEQISKEFMAGMSLPTASRFIERLSLHRLMEYVIPELCNCEGVVQPHQYHNFDVMNHQLMAIDFSEWLSWIGGYMGADDYSDYLSQEVCAGYDRATVLKLAALMHDIGKPLTKSVGKDNKIIFHGHAEKGAEIVYESLSRLKMPNKIIDMVARMVRFHMRVHEMVRDSASSRTIHRFYRVAGDVGKDTVILGMADKLAQKTHIDPAMWDKYNEECKSIIEEEGQPCNQPGSTCEFANGNDLMNWFNLEEGQIIGDTLSHLKEEEAEGNVYDPGSAKLFSRGYLVGRGYCVA